MRTKLVSIACCAIITALSVQALSGCMSERTRTTSLPTASKLSLTDAEVITFPTVSSSIISQQVMQRRLQAVNLLLMARGIPAKISIDVQEGRATDSSTDIRYLEPTQYRTLAAAGNLVDITGVLEESRGLKEINSHMVWRSAAVDGKVFGIPLTRQYDEADCASYTGFYVRTDVLEALKLPLPTNMDGLVSVALQAKEAGLSHKFAYMITNPPYALHRTYEQWPFYVDTESLLIYDSKGGVSIYLGSDIYRNDQRILSDIFTRGLLEVFMDSNEIYSRMTRSWDDYFVGIMPCPPPSGSYADDYTVLQFMPEKANFNFNYAYGNLLGVNVECANPSLALDVLECIYTDREVYDAFVHGKEGTDWKQNDQGEYTALTTSKFHALYAQGHLWRKDAAQGKRQPFFYVDESTLISMPARLFTPSAQIIKGNLTRSSAYLGPDGYIMNRFMKSGAPDALDTALETLKREGVQAYLETCQVEYLQYFDSESQ